MRGHFLLSAANNKKIKQPSSLQIQKQLASLHGLYKSSFNSARAVFSLNYKNLIPISSILRSGYFKLHIIVKTIKLVLCQQLKLKRKHQNLKCHFYMILVAGIVYSILNIQQTHLWANTIYLTYLKTLPPLNCQGRTLTLSLKFYPSHNFQIYTLIIQSNLSLVQKSWMSLKP